MVLFLYEVFLFLILLMRLRTNLDVHSESLL